MSKFWNFLLNVWTHGKNILSVHLLLLLNFTCATILHLITACVIMKSEMVALEIHSLPLRLVPVHLLKALIRCCFAVRWGTCMFWTTSSYMQYRWKLHVQCTQFSEPFTCGTDIIYLKSGGFLQNACCFRIDAYKLYYSAAHWIVTTPATCRCSSSYVRL